MLAENREGYLKSKRKLGLDVNVVETGAGPHKERKGDEKMGGIAGQLADLQLKFDKFREDMAGELMKRDSQFTDLKYLIKSQNVGPRFPTKPNGSGPTCWGCNKFGHVRSNCPDLLKGGQN